MNMNSNKTTLRKKQPGDPLPPLAIYWTTSYTININTRYLVSVNNSEKATIILGDRWWPQKAKQEGDKVSILFYVIQGASLRGRLPPPATPALKEEHRTNANEAGRGPRF